MIPKFTFFILALLNGGWMLFDGVHVIRRGKYFGPPEPGPWSKIVVAVGLNPISLGPVFVGLGFVWLAAALGIIFGYGWGWWLSLAVAFCTLWYIPIGALFSLLSIAVLFYYKAEFG